MLHILSYKRRLIFYVGRFNGPRWDIFLFVVQLLQITLKKLLAYLKLCNDNATQKFCYCLSLALRLPDEMFLTDAPNARFKVCYDQSGEDPC
jgi:hypothetical protein